MKLKNTMLKTILISCLTLITLIATFAADYSVNPFEERIAVVSTSHNHSFVLRGEGTSPKVAVEDQASLPDGYMYNIGAGAFPNLTPMTKYYLDQYIDGNLQNTETVYTLAEAPSLPADAIVFAGNFMDKIAIGLNQRDAENVIIIASKGKFGKSSLMRTNYNKVRQMISQPSFIPGYGASRAKLSKDTYIVYAGPYASPTVKEVQIPEFDEYTFAVIGYNGTGKMANFNTSPASNSIRSKFPMMPPPIAVDPIEMNLEEGYFMAKWKKLPIPANYIISVAEDAAFKNILTEYDAVDFGNIDQSPVMVENHTKLYYRVRAVAGRTKSDWSNIVGVDIK